MPVRLRGHHFLCILTYRGFGYTPAFVANLTAIVTAIGLGRQVVLVEGPDDICNGLTQEDRRACNHDCGRAETRELDRLAVADVAALLDLDLAGPVELDRSMIERLRVAFADRSIRRACARCPWADFCTDIVAEGFSDTKLFTP
jgi:hypothetical protein